MVKISEVHPTLAHSLDTTVRILEAAIELRQKEIDNMRTCMAACQKVMADEIMPPTEHDADVQSEIAQRVDLALEENKQTTALRVAMKRANKE